MSQTDVIEMTSDTIGKSLTQLFVQHARALSKPWQKMSKDEQDYTLDAIKDGVKSAVHRAVNLIASDGKIVVAGTLDAVSIKKQILCSISVPKINPNLLELYSSQGMEVVVVVANAKPFVADIDEVTGEADQRSIDLGHEYHNNDGGGMATAEREELDEVYDQAVEAVKAHQRASISFLQKEIGIGYNRAARLLENLERNGVVSRLGSTGTWSVGSVS